MRLKSLLFLLFFTWCATEVRAQLGPGVVCPSIQYTYIDAQPAGTRFSWSITGGTIIGSTTGSSVVVSWTSADEKQIVCSYTTRIGAGLDFPEQPTGQDVQNIAFLSGGSIYNPGPTSFCPSTGSLTLVGHNGPILRWESSADNSSWTTLPNTTSLTSISYSITQTTYYRAIVALGTCIANNSSTPVIVLPVPGIPGTNSGIGRCGAGQLTLTASGATAGQTYRWYNSSGVLIAGQTGSSYTANFTTSGTYYVSIVNSSGCEGPRASLSVTIVDIPAVPSVTGSSRCDAGSLTLIASGAINQSQFYQWYNVPTGGVALASTSSFTTNFTTTTSYYVSIKNTSGCESNRIQVTGTVQSPVAGTISNSITNSCSPLNGTLTLQGYSGSIDRWEVSTDNLNWFIKPDGQGASLNYSVSATTFMRAVVSANGCSVLTPSVALVVTIPPVPQTNSGIMRCGAGTATFTASGAGSGETYHWYNPSGVIIAGQTSPSYTSSFATSGTYAVAIVSAAGCEGPRASISLTIAQVPTVPSVTPASRFGTGNLTLGASGATGTQFYQWYSAATGGSPLANTATYTTIFAATTAYYVSIKNTQGCESSRVAVTGTVNTNVNCKSCIVTTTVLKEGITAVSQYAPLAVEDIARQISYVDGFGRAKQQIMLQGSPTKKDVVSIVEYDNMGRQPIAYLPYTEGNDGLFKGNAKNNQLAFYLNAVNGDTTTRPFSQSVFEASAAGTVLQKGGPGYEWQIGNGHTTTILNRPSDALDDVRILEYNYTTGTITSPGSYGDGDLLVTQIKNEQGAYSYSFTEKTGRVIMTRQQVSGQEYSTTYNVYDNLGNLRAVIQPEGVKELMTTGFGTLTAAFIDKWCFTYDYDEWGRPVSKKVPGTQPVYFVYNSKDQLVLSQDGEMRKKTQWMFHKYDGLGREVLSGVYTHTAPWSQQVMQGAVTDNMGVGFEKRTAINYSTQHGYTVTQTYPALTTTNSDVMSVNYFDDYDYDNNSSTSNATFLLLGLAQEPTASYRTLGMSTGSKQKVMDYTPVKFLLKSTFYDANGNNIQTSSENMLGGKDINGNRFDFTGRLQELVQYHTANGNTIYLKKKFYYDHAGRILSKTHQVVKNGTTYPVITSSATNYNELGQSAQIKLHSENGNIFLQTVDYKFNIRGWLTAINNSNLTDASDLFGEEIKYNTVTAGHPFPASPRFDGNASEVWWKDGQANKQQSYTYSYDQMGRMVSAKYAARNAGQYVEQEGNDEILTYDLNGNIKTLSRNQWPTGATAKQNIDALVYGYSGNQLKKVDDNAGVNANLGFTNGITDSEEYIYDANGSVIADKNKSITSIKYNVFNLPIEIAIAGQGKIVYTYDASGKKLRKQVVPVAASSITTDYSGAIEYQNNLIQFAITDEGRVLLQTSPSYEYAIRDHTGNARVYFDKNPVTGLARIIQKTDYYPFGMTMPGSYNSGTQNKYLYSGKELQDELGLGWYNYGARMYDPQLGKWHAVDPMAEKAPGWTPYRYAFDNPTRYVDPNGAYETDGHFWTVYLMATLMGSSHAFEIAYYTERPDNIMSPEGDHLLPTMTWLNPYYQTRYHALTGNETEGERSVSLFQAEMAGNFKELGIALHRLGDSHAHSDITGHNYSRPFGHAFWGHEPDKIANRPGLYVTYVKNLQKALGTWLHNCAQVDEFTFQYVAMSRLGTEANSAILETEVRIRRGETAFDVEGDQASVISQYLRTRNINYSRDQNQRRYTAQFEKQTLLDKEDVKVTHVTLKQEN